MVASSVPDHRYAALGTLCQQRLKKGNGVLRIALSICFDETLLGVDVECTIVGLLLSLIDNRYFNALLFLPPYITANISPESDEFRPGKTPPTPLKQFQACEPLTKR